MYSQLGFDKAYRSLEGEMCRKNIVLTFTPCEVDIVGTPGPTQRTFSDDSVYIVRVSAVEVHVCKSLAVPVLGFS